MTYCKLRSHHHTKKYWLRVQHKSPEHTHKPIPPQAPEVWFTSDHNYAIYYSRLSTCVTCSYKSTHTKNQKCTWILLKRTHTRRNHKRRWRTWTCEICSRLSRHPNHMGVPINYTSPYEHTGVLHEAQQTKKTAVTTSCFWPRFTGIYLFAYYLRTSALILHRQYELHINYAATVIS
jgi:hypothetical protein